jgi:predicted HTH transcriptional regulator
MDKQKIIDFILQEGEGYKIEFKEAIGHIAREMVAFANASGGKIFVGITDTHKIKGIEVNERLKSQIQDIARNCDPSVKILLETIPYKDKKVLLVDVYEGDNRPYSCGEGFFIRNGPITEKLRRDEIVTIFQKEGRIRFDKLVNPKFNFNQDFDIKKLEDFLSRAGIKTNLVAEDILLNLGVAEKQERKLFLNNSGILFFAKDAKEFFESTYVTCARFKGNDRSTVIDRTDIYGSLINQVEESMKFVKRNIRVGFGEKMGSGITRMNRWMLDWGLEKPKIGVSENFFEITFYGPGESEIKYREINYKAYSLNDRQIKVLKYLEEKGRFTLSEYIGLTGASKSTSRRDLNDLLKKRLIERKGRKGGGRYSYYVSSPK